jgi:hypothetical protein
MEGWRERERENSDQTERSSAVLHLLLPPRLFESLSTTGDIHTGKISKLNLYTGIYSRVEPQSTTRVPVPVT